MAHVPAAGMLVETEASPEAWPPSREDPEDAEPSPGVVVLASGVALPPLAPLVALGLALPLEPELPGAAGCGPGNARPRPSALGLGPAPTSSGAAGRSAPR